MTYWAADAELEAIKRFRRHHERNPHLYRAFRRLALQIAERGRTHYSARTLLHVMRFHTTLAEGPESEFKINNDWSPFYGRMLAAELPETRDLFREKSSAADRLTLEELLELVRFAP